MVSWASCHMVQMLAEYHWFYSRKEREVRWLGGGSEKLPRVLPVQLRGEYDCIWEYCFPLTSTEILEETILWTLYFYRKDMMLRGYITCSRPDENEDTIKAVDIRSSASSLVVFFTTPAVWSNKNSGSTGMDVTCVVGLGICVAGETYCPNDAR